MSLIENAQTWIFHDQNKKLYIYDFLTFMAVLYVCIAYLMRASAAFFAGNTANQKQYR